MLMLFKNNILFVIGTVMTSTVIYYIGIWILIVEKNTESRNKILTVYQSYFPNFIKNPKSQTFALILLCLIAFISFNYISSKATSSALRYFSKMMRIINLLLIGWLLFTLL